MEVEGGNNNVDCGCAATSWLQVALVVARVSLQYEEDGAAMYTVVTEEGSNSKDHYWLLFATRIAAGHDQGGWLREVTIGNEGIKEIGWLKGGWTEGGRL
ncbi:hypothetical protein GW17_00056255 [Ensete ventricosum]|nr:hypothetical protein GW17_00056255 [Ensete ventricosum]